MSVLLALMVLVLGRGAGSLGTQGRSPLGLSCCCLCVARFRPPRPRQGQRASLGSDPEGRSPGPEGGVGVEQPGPQRTTVAHHVVSLNFPTRTESKILNSFFFFFYPSLLCAVSCEHLWFN